MSPAVRLKCKDWWKSPVEPQGRQPRRPKSWGGQYHAHLVGRMLEPIAFIQRLP
ncbi:MAG: hypothetical protein PVH43_08405 [Desulfobacterales bacterium]